MTKPIALLVVDDHPVVRDDLVAILGTGNRTEAVTIALQQGLVEL